MIENTEIHDVRITAEGQHLECVMSHSPGVTFRGNTFRNCGVFDISLGRGDWWGQPQYGNVTIENNLFGHTVDGGAAGDWHYYGLAWWLETLNGARVVNNTFENAVSMDRANGGTGGVWANNIGGGWTCEPGVTYAGNVGKACGGQDKAVNPSASSYNQTAPMGWVNPAAFDFHLTASSRGRRRRQRAVTRPPPTATERLAPARPTPAPTNTTRGVRPPADPGPPAGPASHPRPSACGRPSSAGTRGADARGRARLRVVTSRKARVSVRLHPPARPITARAPASGRPRSRRPAARGRYRFGIACSALRRSSARARRYRLPVVARGVREGSCAPKAATHAFAPRALSAAERLARLRTSGRRGAAWRRAALALAQRSRPSRSSGTPRGAPARRRRSSPTASRARPARGAPGRARAWSGRTGR